MHAWIAVAGLAAAGAAAGAGTTGAGALIAIVSILGLTNAWLSRCTAGLGALLIVVPTITRSLDPDDAATVALGVLVGFAVVTIVAGAAGVRLPAEPVTGPVAARHAIVLGLLAAACVPLTTSTGHGYWLMLTLSAVLTPVPKETLQRAGGRIAGAIAGVALAAIAVLALPTDVVIGISIAAAFASLAWLIAGDDFRQTALGTAVVILVVSSGSFSSQASTSFERLLMIGGGALVAAAAALLLHRLDDQSASSGSGWSG
jgi:hypothetical protein